MKPLRLIAPSLLLISACLLCFEILATRISSVIFVNSYAFFILSLSVLGLGAGGILAYYRLSGISEDRVLSDIAPKLLLALAVSKLVFVLAVPSIPAITQPVFFFFLLFIPFFLAGIFYAVVFKNFARSSFLIYASDLSGAAIGSLMAIAAITFLGPINSILLLFILITTCAMRFWIGSWPGIRKTLAYGLSAIACMFLFLNGSNTLTGPIPIGYFPEKDFYHVYSDPSVTSTIMESRWSVFGRSDLVSHSHQDMVRHLFVDGAAGSQMYRFNGDISNADVMLQNMLLAFSSTTPLLFLEEDEREHMLVIGPGGGKEVLAGLISGVKHITGVEINADFVGLVEDHSDFNGGIYTDLPNVDIHVMEGRQYVRSTESRYDIIKMVLPSTQQVQHIENYALAENYLLTVEALEDYLNILKPKGSLIFTVYNEWELKRLVLTAIKALENTGVAISTTPLHFKILEDPYAPTLVIRKQPFYPEEIADQMETIRQFPSHIPRFTYYPYLWDQLEESRVNRFMMHIQNQTASINNLISMQPFDIAPVYDDSPYFYKIEKGIPAHFQQLFAALLGFNFLVVFVPYFLIRGKRTTKKLPPVTRATVLRPLLIFSMLGLGFMVLEVSLFQKLVLYLGTPTVSLSILLSSLLAGMGLGSFFSSRLFAEHHIKRLNTAALLVCICSTIAIFLYPWILDQLLAYNTWVRALTAFFLLLPLGFLLGMPFPSALKFLSEKNMETIIPWMYGVNGAMSVLGSVVAVILSMLWGFTPAFFIGILCYTTIFLATFKHSEE
ncbi:hypothetical protein QLX67_00920 [Balneolaceae bacterium ANBcel3]|nr:hypothetical protein [Balneolaceae bacterium ANBcel3]